MTKIQKVNLQGLEKIVQEMKPKIGFFGGRYFTTSEKTYTMNQITKMAADLGIDSSNALMRTIRNKNKKANVLLKKACCFQKKMTKLKQKYGNLKFNKLHPTFGGKEPFLVASQSIIPSPKITLSALSSVNSTTLVSLGEKKIASRDDFMNADWKTPPAIWSYSKDLLPESVLKRLIQLKKDLACGVKYELGDELSNMEGALHTFLTPISVIHMVGDKGWMGPHGVYGKNFEGNQARKVVFSGNVQPDFENSSVLMKIAEVKPPADEEGMRQIDKDLAAHMIHHLTQDHCLPNPGINNSIKGLKEVLEGLLSESVASIAEVFHDQVVTLNDHIISLEVMFNVYLHQVRNEMRLLEETLPQGYVYTISPPSIFMKTLGGAPATEIFNRLQALAFKCVQQEIPFKNLKVVAFDDYADKGMVEQLKKAFPDKAVISKSLLFKGTKEDNTYLENEALDEEVRELCMNAALVIHNNSDGFGQNIEFEGESSLDGVVGVNSDAYATVARERTDYFVTSATGDFRPL